jgi:hypothetical protein
MAWLALRLFLSIIWLLPVPVWSQTPAPQGIVAIFDEYLVLEEEIECHAWNAALARMARLDQGLREIAGSADPRQAAVADAFRPRLAALGERLREEDVIMSYRAFFRLRGELLALLETTNYRLPALFRAMRRDLETAIASMEKGQWEQLTHELDELELLYYSAIPEMREREVPRELNDSFLSLLPKIRSVAENRDVVPLDRLFRQMRDLFQVHESLVPGI